MLTLFGDYIGTLKGEGFYWVNPFCTAVNPAAGTVLSQSGDVQQRPVVQADREKDGKKISLKVMTLKVVYSITKPMPPTTTAAT